ncbi:MAG: GAF domain-containing SpoIIE family protein phosphatase [Planctomycetota bacterium]
MKRFIFWGREPADGSSPDGGSSPEAQEGLLTGNPREDQASMQILLESIAEVTSGMELDDVLDRIARKSIQVTDAERALVLLGEDGRDLEIRIARGNRGQAIDGDLQYSRSMVARCLAEGQAVRSVVRSDQEALELGQSVFDLKLRAVMCAPLVSRGRTLGVIYVDSKAQRREFSGRDLALFGALSAQIAIAVENARLYRDSLEKVRLQREIELARQIQRHLLTEVPSDLRGVDFALHFSACDQTSGDTYDVVSQDDGRLFVAIADATGHGIGASLLTHAFQAALRTYLELIQDLAAVTPRLNDRLLERSEDGHFLSMLLVALDPERRHLHYVNAGHPGLVLARNGVVREYERTGMVLGVVGGQDYPVAGPIAIEPGDLLFLRTDGVDETMNQERELFGSERVHRVLAEASSGTAREVVAHVQAALDAHCGTCTQDDDVTMIAIKVL